MCVYIYIYIYIYSSFIYIYIYIYIYVYIHLSGETGSAAEGLEKIQCHCLLRANDYNGYLSMDAREFNISSDR